jgi:hypothetical protein
MSLDFPDIVTGASALGSLFYISAVFSAAGKGETGQIPVSLVIAGACLVILAASLLAKNKA